MNINDRLDEIEQRAQAATEGPWRNVTFLEGNRTHGWLVGSQAETVFMDKLTTAPDATFIAHARTDVPALVKALRAVMEVLDNDGWSETSSEFPCWAVNADDVRQAITDALTD